MSQQKMREALDAICSAKLCSINSMSSRVEMLRLMDLAIDKLREALAADRAARAEPVVPVVPTHIRDAALRLRQQGIMGAADAQLVILEWILAAPAEPSGNSGEFAAPAGEQVRLTDAALSALRDAATSLETISRLAGRKTYGQPPIETFMDSFADVRAYAASRASVARTALAAHEAKSGGAA